MNLDINYLNFRNNLELEPSWDCNFQDCAQIQFTNDLPNGGERCSTHTNQEFIALELNKVS